MQFPKLKVFGDVQQGLGPLLDELGLKARMREWMGYPTIQFETPDGTMVSPIRFVMRTKHQPEEPGSLWKGFSIQYASFDMEALPDSDWTFVNFAGLSDYYLKGTDIESLQILKEELRAYKLILTEEHPKATYESTLFQAYIEVRKSLAHLVILPVECNRIGELEVLSFNDKLGRNWVLMFGDRFKIELDGVIVMESKYYEIDDIEIISSFVKRSVLNISPDLKSDQGDYVP
ncbi:hypothetical protein [Neorhizobium huautlense]|uniref:hypothetical protein n=1 Tax=Neorhizobium huautlense TaxID=67774 RepID=UPI000CF9853B|nr:hypothetical protein [Neorhizobium huautlense]